MAADINIEKLREEVNPVYSTAHSCLQIVAPKASLETGTYYSAQNSDGAAVDSVDHSHIREWMTLYVITFVGLITCIVIRKKETTK